SKLSSVSVQDLQATRISNKGQMELSVDDIPEFKIVADGDIIVGNPDNQRRAVELNGQIKVKGALNLNSHTVTYGEEPPVSGQWNRGDIIFNEKPKVNGYIGWVCLETGVPGRWTAFGGIIPDWP
ncbi:hypothetical protein EB118_13975, partial [bacterium]|nr:hypothetical protein [bacterium]